MCLDSTMGSSGRSSCRIQVHSHCFMAEGLMRIKTYFQWHETIQDNQGVADDIGHRLGLQVVENVL